MHIPKAWHRGLDGKATILRHMHKTGCTIAGQQVWTEAEHEVVRRHFPDIAAIKRRLPRRSQGAIHRRANLLRLVPPRPFWRPDEVKRLPPPYKSLMPIDEIVALFPNRSKKQIWSKASRLKVRRPKRSPKATGLAIVDLIRWRAFKLGYTMADLNEWTGFRSYWKGPRYLNWRAIEKALQILGGRIVPVWPS